MAYTQENLTLMNGNVKAGVVPAVYSYWNEAGDTVTGAGFFVDNRLNVGDQIWLITATYDQQILYYVSAVTAGAATVVASTTPT